MNKTGNPNFVNKWNTGSTVAVRVPEQLKDPILEIARAIDRGDIFASDILAYIERYKSSVKREITEFLTGQPYPQSDYNMIESRLTKIEQRLSKLESD